MPAGFQEGLVLVMPAGVQSLPMRHHQRTIDDTIQQQLDEELPARLADGIRNVMGEQHVSQRELARRLSWTQTSVCRRLNGITTISAADVVKIAHALETTPERLGFPASGKEVRS